MNKMTAQCVHDCESPLTILVKDDGEVIAYHDVTPPKPRMGFVQEGRGCLNCGQVRRAHSTSDICPRVVDPSEPVDPSGAGTTWWQ